jgi:CopG antitoxin of type II toxin-antitoxin system
MSTAKLRPSKMNLPKFENEDQEREFWATHDSADYIDWHKAKPVKLSNLRPTTKIEPELRGRQ